MKEQSATISKLHHAIKQGLITVAGIHAELGEIIAGRKPGRQADREIIIFDSTGTRYKTWLPQHLFMRRQLSVALEQS